MSFISIQLSRLSLKFETLRTIALFSSILPYLPFVLMSYYRHIEFSIFWILLILPNVIDSQSHSRIHFLYGICFCITYLILSFSLFYVLNNPNFGFMRLIDFSDYSSSFDLKSSSFSSELMSFVSDTLAEKSGLSLETISSQDINTAARVRHGHGHEHGNNTKDRTMNTHENTYVKSLQEICKNTGNIQELKYNFYCGGSIHSGKETLLFFGIFITFASLIFMGDKIGNRNLLMAERKLLLEEIRKGNFLLREELDQLKNGGHNVNLSEGTFVSPISKVITIIRELQVTNNLDENTLHDLDYVIHLLLSNQLFKPQLVNSSMESEVNQWLKQITEDQKDELFATHLVSNSTRKLTKDHNREPRQPLIINIPHQVVKLLAKIDTWDFPIFSLANESAGESFLNNPHYLGRPLFFLGMRLFEYYQFEEQIAISRDTISRFLIKVESNYRNNPYHNSTHAADVLHAMHYFLTKLKMKESLQIEEIFACIVAAAIHDVDHPGFNNSFMSSTNNPTALRYNDVSILEHYHCSKGFEIMQEEGCNIFEDFSVDQYKVCRSSIISMVLATDMVNHFQYITKFKNILGGEEINVTDFKCRTLLMEVALKCADVSNACKVPELSFKWIHLIMSEFFKQGDEERLLRLPVSPLMDRYSISVSKCQLSFIEFIVFPIYELWAQYHAKACNTFPAMENMACNRDFWKSMSDNGVGRLPGSSNPK